MLLNSLTKSQFVSLDIKVHFTSRINYLSDTSIKLTLSCYKSTIDGQVWWFGCPSVVIFHSWWLCFCSVQFLWRLIAPSWYVILYTINKCSLQCGYKTHQPLNGFTVFWDQIITFYKYIILGLYITNAWIEQLHGRCPWRFTVLWNQIYFYQ